MGKMVYRLRREKQQNADGHMIHQNSYAKRVSTPSIFLDFGAGQSLLFKFKLFAWPAFFFS
jgi:hypothetical protein